jgi:hypothetical protein
MNEIPPEEPIGTAQIGEPFAMEGPARADLRTTPIRVHIGERLIDHPEHWELGVGRRGDREVWGLVYGGAMTHMCYDPTYAPPAEAVAKVREFGWWYFDAGRELRVRVEDLEEAFKILKVLDHREATSTSGMFGGDPDEPV